MDRGGPETVGLGGPLRVSSETLGAPRDARVASWLDGGVRRGTNPSDLRVMVFFQNDHEPLTLTGDLPHPYIRAHRALWP